MLDKTQVLEKYIKLTREYNANIAVDGDTIHIIVPREKLVEIVSKLVNEYSNTFRVCVGTDERPVNGHFSLTHIFTDDKNGFYVLVKTYAEGDNPVFPSIINVVPGADWCEMEAHDLLGFEFTGRTHYRLVLPPEWPEGYIHLERRSI